MARITICDLCKDRIKDNDESKQGTLALSFYTEINMVACDNTDCCAIPGVYCEPCEEQNVPQKSTLLAELCLSCTTLLTKTINGDDPLVASKKAPKKRERFGAPSVECANIVPTGDPIGPSEEEKAEREPTKELLEDEMKVVPSNVDIRKGSKSVRELNRKIVKARGGCDHHFKSWENGKVTCGPAPDGFEGELASFKGCGRALTAGEY